MKFDGYLKEQEIKKRYMSDPLFAKILNAKDKKEFDKAVETCKSIRGDTAFQNFVKASKTLSEAQQKSKELKMLEAHYRTLRNIEKDLEGLWGATTSKEIGMALDHTLRDFANAVNGVSGLAHRYAEYEGDYEAYVKGGTLFKGLGPHTPKIGR